MKTIAVISQKGGVGKSMISSGLAVAAARDELATLLIDLDPQASNAKWAKRRDKADPVVISAHASMLEDEIKKAHELGCELLILDTAPHSNDTALQAARLADVVIVPCGVSIDDIEAIPNTIDIAKFAGKPFFVVLNKVNASTAAEIQEAIDAFSELQAPVCPARLGERVAFKRARKEGLSAQEFIPDGKVRPDEKAAGELQQLYTYTRLALDTSTPPQDETSIAPSVEVSIVAQADDLTRPQTDTPAPINEVQHV